MSKELSIKDCIENRAKEGFVTVSTFEGLMEAKITEIIKKPVDVLLYDLNRDFATILTYIEINQKWINDYASSQIIVALKNRIDELENELNDIKSGFNKWLERFIKSTDSNEGGQYIVLLTGEILYCGDIEYKQWLDEKKVIYNNLKFKTSI